MKWITHLSLTNSSKYSINHKHTSRHTWHIRTCPVLVSLQMLPNSAIPWRGETLADQNPWWRRFASLLSNRTLVCENITEASLFGIHVILWSTSTLDLKQNPPRRICTHVFAASHDATCSECYRGIWLPLSLPCSKMLCFPFRPHEMLQSLVQIFTVFWAGTTDTGTATYLGCYVLKWLRSWTSQFQ